MVSPELSRHALEELTTDPNIKQMHRARTIAAVYSTPRSESGVVVKRSEQFWCLRSEKPLPVTRIVNL